MLLLVLEHAFSYGLITRIIQVELGFICASALATICATDHARSNTLN